MPFYRNNYIKKNRNLRGFLGIFVTAFVVSILAFGGISAKAGSEGLVEPVYCTDGTLYPIVDYADLLTDDEEQALAEKIYELEYNYDSTLVILTLDSLGNRSAMEYADDFYDYNGYGMGENHDGAIFLISMENRDYWFGTTGSAIYTYSDSDIDYICGECRGDLSAGNYYGAFDTLINECSDELYSEAQSQVFTVGKFLICLTIGAVIGLIILLGFIGQLKTVAPAKGASDYTSSELKLTKKSDLFIRSSISKTKRESSSGSSTHTGSSGTSHGGGGGHF